MTTNRTARLREQSGGRSMDLDAEGRSNVRFYSSANRAEMQTPAPVYVGAAVVGVVSDGVFRKVVRGSRHMLRSPRAWALDLESLRDAEGAGAVTVEIVDQESGIVYMAPCSRIHLLGFRLNRGHGEQIALLLRLWQQLPAAGSWQQAALFGAAAV